MRQTEEKVGSDLRELRARDPGKYQEVLELIYSVSEDLSSVRFARP
jgi:hypothetical protein